MLLFDVFNDIFYKFTIFGSLSPFLSRTKTVTCDGTHILQLYAKVFRVQIRQWQFFRNKKIIIPDELYFDRTFPYKVNSFRVKMKKVYKLASKLKF